MLYEFNLEQFKAFSYGKCCKSYDSQILNFVVKHYDYLDNPSQILSLKPLVRHNALKSTVCLSKYLGCYLPHKAKLKNYGTSFNSPDAHGNFIG